MDVLDEIRDDINKERFVNFLQNYGRYVAILILFVFIGFITYFWWDNHKNNVLLEEAGEYGDAMNFNDKDKVSKLEKLKTKKTVYSDLAKLQLAAYYFGDKDFNRAIHNYELLVSSNNTDKLYKDYAKLMIIKIKILSGKVSSEDGIIMYEDFYKNAEYFNNLAVLGESILLINKGEKDKVSSRINEILTDNESPSLLIDLAKIIDKRIQQ